MDWSRPLVPSEGRASLLPHSSFPPSRTVHSGSPSSLELPHTHTSPPLLRPDRPTSDERPLLSPTHPSIQTLRILKPLIPSRPSCPRCTWTTDYSFKGSTSYFVLDPPSTIATFLIYPRQKVAPRDSDTGPVSNPCGDRAPNVQDGVGSQDGNERSRGRTREVSFSKNQNSTLRVLSSEWETRVESRRVRDSE